MSLRFLLRFIVAGLVVVLVAEVAARVVIRPDHQALRWHDFATEIKVGQMDQWGDDPTMIVVGTSMAQQDLVPAALSERLDGNRVYNAGLNGGVPAVVEPWLTGPVMDRMNVESVVWALSALDISAVYGTATYDAYNAALNTKAGTPAAAERTAAAVSELVANRTILREPSSLAGVVANNRAEERVAARSTIGEAGERIDFARVVAPSRAAEVRGRITPFALDREDLAAITRTVRRLEAAGIPVVFVELPVPPRFTALYRSGPDEHALVPATITALGEELGVPVVLLGSDYTDTDFVDFTHLDKAAAERFSIETAEALNQPL